MFSVMLLSTVEAAGSQITLEESGVLKTMEAMWTAISTTVTISCIYVCTFNGISFFKTGIPCSSPKSNGGNFDGSPFAASFLAIYSFTFLK